MLHRIAYRGEERMEGFPTIPGAAFERLEATAWPAVFDDWERREVVIWDRHWQERGYTSWREWRSRSLEAYGYAALGLEALEWTIHRVAAPLRTVPDICSGPYKGWARYHPDGRRESRSFRDIVRHPEAGENGAIRTALSRFRKGIPERIIGLRDPEGTVLLIEGHHRCAALAMVAGSLAFAADLTIALGEIPPDKAEAMGAMMRGEVPLPEDFR
jgi:hypothetical protein